MNSFKDPKNDDPSKLFFLIHHWELGYDRLDLSILLRFAAKGPACTGVWPPEAGGWGPVVSVPGEGRQVVLTQSYLGTNEFTRYSLKDPLPNRRYTERIGETPMLLISIYFPPPND